METRRFQDRHCSETRRRTTDTNRLLNVAFARDDIMHGKITRFVRANGPFAGRLTQFCILILPLSHSYRRTYIFTMAATPKAQSDCTLIITR